MKYYTWPHSFYNTSTFYGPVGTDRLIFFIAPLAVGCVTMNAMMLPCYCSTNITFCDALVYIEHR
jgi:hypothetical protein